MALAAGMKAKLRLIGCQARKSSSTVGNANPRRSRGLSGCLWRPIRSARRFFGTVLQSAHDPRTGGPQRESIAANCSRPELGYSYPGLLPLALHLAIAGEWSNT